MATTTAWDPKRLAIAVMSDGSARAAELIDTRSAPDSMIRFASSTDRTPPPTVKGIARTSATWATRDVMVEASSGVAVMSRKTNSSAPPSL